MARIDPNVLRTTAELARLELSAGEADRLLVRLETVLAHFAALDAVDTTGVEVPFTPLSTDDLPHADAASRASTHRTMLSQAEVLANAPRARDGAFVVPRMVER